MPTIQTEELFNNLTTQRNEAEKDLAEGNTLSRAESNYVLLLLNTDFNSLSGDKYREFRNDFQKYFIKVNDKFQTEVLQKQTPESIDALSKLLQEEHRINYRPEITNAIETINSFQKEVEAQNIAQIKQQIQRNLDKEQRSINAKNETPMASKVPSRAQTPASPESSITSTSTESSVTSITGSTPTSPTRGRSTTPSQPPPPLAAVRARSTTPTTPPPPISPKSGLSK